MFTNQLPLVLTAGRTIDALNLHNFPQTPSQKYHYNISLYLKANPIVTVKLFWIDIFISAEWLQYLWNLNSHKPKCWRIQPLASECNISAGINEHHVLCRYRFLHLPTFILFSPCVKQFSPRDARLAKGFCGNSHKLLILQISESHASSSVSPTAPSPHSAFYISQAPPALRTQTFVNEQQRIRPGAPSSHSWAPKKKDSSLNEKTQENGGVCLCERKRKTWEKHNYAFLFNLDAHMKDAWLTDLWWWMLH